MGAGLKSSMARMRDKATRDLKTKIQDKKTKKTAVLMFADDGGICSEGRKQVEESLQRWR